MKVESIEWDGTDADACASRVRALAPSLEGVTREVGEMIVAVGAGGDVLPDPTAARPRALHLEALDRDRPRRAPLVADAHGPVALTPLHDRLAPGGAFGPPEAHPVAGPQPDLEQGALGEGRGRRLGLRGPAAHDGPRTRACRRRMPASQRS